MFPQTDPAAPMAAGLKDGSTLLRGYAPRAKLNTGPLGSEKEKLQQTVPPRWLPLAGKWQILPNSRAVYDNLVLLASLCRRRHRGLRVLSVGSRVPPTRLRPRDARVAS